MRVLVFGRTGQVARELARAAPGGAAPVFLGREEADLGQPETCASAIRAARPAVVINAAAWTAVDKAETQEQAATIVNAAAPGAMARACADLGIPFLHVSTDYVFDGGGALPFKPSDATRPMNAYGRSKLAGERAVSEACADALILRTSWVVSAHGANFVTTMLRLGAERELLRVVADQIGGPTPAADIAAALWTCADAMKQGAAGGIHHFSGAPDITWAGLARAVMKGAGLACRIEDIPTAAYPTPAARPANSRLDCRSFEAAFGIRRPDWQAGLRKIIAEWRGAR